MRQKRVDKRKYHYIYRVDNKINGKFYYGRHSTDNLNDGYMGSGTYLARSKRKYGLESFKLTILEFVPSYDELICKEKAIINKDMVAHPLCMNLVEGGHGGGGFFSKEHKYAFHAAGGKAVNKIRTQRLQEKLKNDPNFAQYMRDISRESALRQNLSGCGNPMYGKHHSDETRAKQSKQHLGEKNHSFGKMWMMKDGTSVMIHKHQQEEYESLGYVKGRLCPKKRKFAEVPKRPTGPAL